MNGMKSGDEEERGKENDIQNSLIPTKTTSGFLIKTDPAVGMQDAWP